MIACDAPIPLGGLLDWWLSDMEMAQADTVEEHFFECDYCTARLASLRELGTGIVAISRTGGMPLTTTTSLINRLARDHRSVRHYVARPGQTINCSSTHSDDWLVGRLLADLDDVQSVGLVVDTVDGTPFAQLDDIAVDRATGEVLMLYPSELMAMPEAAALRIRLLDGERVIAEYVFDHTPADPVG